MSVRKEFLFHDDEWVAETEWDDFSLAENWKKTPAAVYEIPNSTGILDNYIIPSYDVLHTLGKEYLVEDITEFVKEKGVSLQKRQKRKFFS